MLEGEFTRRLKPEIEKRMKQAVVWKHSDRFTRGIPDLSVTWGSSTLWIEVKMEPEMPTKIQEYFLRKLGFGAALICASRDGRSAAFTSPFTGKTSFVTFDRLSELIAEQF